MIQQNTLYVHFGYLAKNVDSKIVDKYGEIVLGFNGKGKGVNPTIISASTYIPQNREDIQEAILIHSDRQSLLPISE
jgi:hypothetical protein